MSSSNANGISVTYTYDNLNRLVTVVDNKLPVSQNTTTSMYDPANNLATATHPNGIQHSFTYYDLNRVTVSGARILVYDFENRVKSMNNGALTIVMTAMATAYRRQSAV